MMLLVIAVVVSGVEKPDNFTRFYNEGFSQFQPVKDGGFLILGKNKPIANTPINAALPVYQYGFFLGKVDYKGNLLWSNHYKIASVNKVTVSETDNGYTLSSESFSDSFKIKGYLNLSFDGDSIGYSADSIPYIIDSCFTLTTSDNIVLSIEEDTILKNKYYSYFDRTFYTIREISPKGDTVNQFTFEKIGVPYGHSGAKILMIDSIEISDTKSYRYAITGVYKTLYSRRNVRFTDYFTSSGEKLGRSNKTTQIDSTWKVTDTTEGYGIRKLNITDTVHLSNGSILGAWTFHNVSSSSGYKGKIYIRHSYYLAIGTLPNTQQTLLENVNSNSHNPNKQLKYVPSQNKITITGSQPVIISIIDMRGRVLFRQSNIIQSILLPKLASGVYTAKIVNNVRSRSIRFTIQ